MALVRVSPNEIRPGSAASKEEEEEEEAVRVCAALSEKYKSRN